MLQAATLVEMWLKATISSKRTQIPLFENIPNGSYSQKVRFSLRWDPTTLAERYSHGLNNYKDTKTLNVIFTGV
jgi:hypothetical protein